MKLKITIITIALAILIIFIAGCQKATTLNTKDITDVSELVLNENDLSQIGYTININPLENAQFDIANGTNCRTERYNTSEFSPLEQYSICYYNATALNDTTVIVIMHKFTNMNDMNGSYGYSSSHLYGAGGLISENTYGDQSRFHVNDPSDYGGQFDKPGEYYYNLYFTKGLYVIQISSGKDKEAKAYVENTARTILSKFN